MPEVTHEWQLDVSSKLGALVQQTADLAAQVTRQNGNVAKLWSEMDRLKGSITRGENPPSKQGMDAISDLQDRVGAMERKEAASAADQEATRKTAGWFADKIVLPLVCVLIGVVATLMLENAGLFTHQTTTTTTTESTKTSK